MHIHPGFLCKIDQCAIGFFFCDSGLIDCCLTIQWHHTGQVISLRQSRQRISDNTISSISFVNVSLAIIENADANRFLWTASLEAIIISAVNMIFSGQLWRHAMHLHLFQKAPYYWCYLLTLGNHHIEVISWFLAPIPSTFTNCNFEDNRFDLMVG